MCTGKKKESLAVLNNSFWLCRIVYLRYLAFLYFVAFSVAFNQNEALIGPNGLTPLDTYMERVLNHLQGSRFDQFLQMPTVFFFLAPTSANLNGIAFVGMILSTVIVVLGSANSIILALLWMLYMSLVNVGQTWYSFGWESQLLETGFLAIFMVPLLSLEQFPNTLPTPALALWGNRWLIFRIMIGAGMIKMRGDACWRDLTCMNYHYQTQPVPNPLSSLLHASPEIIHKVETLGNHVVELLLPWLVLVPYFRPVFIAGGAAQIVFQWILILSGNLSFLNWLTILPCICTLDDAFLSPFFSAKAVAAARASQLEWKNFRGNYLLKLLPSSSTSCANPWKKFFSKLCVYTRWCTHIAVFGLICVRSQPVVVNLLSRSQAMNTSFDPFRIVNTYGAFGSITKTRHEVILQGAVIDSQGHGIANKKGEISWVDYNFKCKPGDINRTPCILSPYHLRLDWLMWFAAFQSYQQCPWLVHLVVKILGKDEKVLSLMSSSNREGETGQLLQNVTHIRAQLYEYRYSYRNDRVSEEEGTSSSRLSTAAEEDWEVGVWWKRKEVREYMPPVSLHDASVGKFLDHHGWRDH